MPQKKKRTMCKQASFQTARMIYVDDHTDLVIMSIFNDNRPSIRGDRRGGTDWCNLGQQSVVTQLVGSISERQLHMGNRRKRDSERHDVGPDLGGLSVSRV